MRPERPAAIAGLHFEAFGTTCSLFAVGGTRHRLESVEEWARVTGAALSRFDPHSELSRLNAGAGGGWRDVSGVLQEVLMCACSAFEASGGLVNVAVLQSMVAIGYGRSIELGPTEVAPHRAMPLPPLPTVLELRPGRARLAAGAGIDLGGVAKGWIADRARERLGPDSLANIGGDLVAGGGGPEGSGWPVGVAGVTLLLRDQAAATSSVRRRRWGDMHHLVDPRTGLPAQSGLEEVSVVSRDGVHAEIAAKTALLLGPDLAPAYCAANCSAWWLDGRRDR